MKNIIIITEVGRVFPSGYIRAIKYKKILMEDGYNVKYLSRRSEKIALLMMSENRISKKLLNVGFGYILKKLDNIIIYCKGKYLLLIIKKYDIVFFQAVHSYELVRKIKNNSNCTLIYDITDGLWLPVYNKYFGGKFNDLIKLTNYVTSDNKYAIDYAKGLNIEGNVLPDQCSIELFDKKRNQYPKYRNKIIIGWIGSDSTLFNLYLIFEVLEQLFEKFNNIHLRIVGAGTNTKLLPPFEKVNFSTLPVYTEEEMVEEVLKMNIGLFPLFNIDNSIFRGILKATIYMSGEACVIASPVGQTNDLIRDNENGMLAKTKKEWYEKLTLLIKNKEIRDNVVKNGLQTVRSKYSLQSTYKVLDDVLSKF